MDGMDGTYVDPGLDDPVSSRQVCDMHHTAVFVGHKTTGTMDREKENMVRCIDDASEDWMDAGSIAIPTERAWWITRTLVYVSHTSMSKTGYEATQSSMAIPFEGHIPSNSSTEWVSK